MASTETWADAMSVQNERRRSERRQAGPNGDDELSPEYLALLEVCGGEIRATDRAALAERREAMDAEGRSALETGKEVAAPAALASADRRGGRAS
ncbi:MAG TPA: hypothetical protein VLD35_12990 [Caldimonas sp.]|nr:hypothetical protein [Caldimonas sp.]